MKLMILILCLVLPILSFSKAKIKFTNSEDCTPVDYRSAFDYEPRNQLRMSWCYAFTTADMIGYEYKTEKISAADIALNYNKHWLPKAMNGFKKFYLSLFNTKNWVRRNREHVTGFIKIATKKAIKKGICLQDDAPDNYLIKVDKEKRSSFNVSYKYAMDDILRVYRSIEKDDLSIDELDFYYKTPNTTEEDFRDILANYSPSEIFSELNNRSCTSRIELEPRKYKYHFKGKKFFKRLNRQLDNEKIVAIDYHSGVYRKPSNFSKGLKGLHTSSIVARRFNPEKRSCEYLIRDSYGPHCDRYHPSFDCEEGHVWMEQKMLYNALVSYSYFK